MATGLLSQLITLLNPIRLQLISAPSLAAPNGVTICDFSLPSTEWVNGSNGAITWAGAPKASTANPVGTVARFILGDGDVDLANKCIGGSVGLPGSGADVELPVVTQTAFSPVLDQLTLNINLNGSLKVDFRVTMR